MSSERGFTIVEVLVASFVVVVGLLGSVAMIDAADVQTSATKAREGGVSLQRELVEVARSIPYDELVQSAAVEDVAEKLPDSQLTGGGWKVSRRGIVYTVSLGVCSVDDARDGTGPHDAGLFCTTGSGQTAPAECRSALTASGAPADPSSPKPDCGIDVNGDGGVDGIVDESNPCGGGTCPVGAGGDANPDDYKRIVTLVRWDRGTGLRYAIQTATVPNPGLSTGPAIEALTPLNLGATSSSFSVETSRPPAAVAWTVDGEPKGTASGSGTTWSFTWDHGGPDATRDGTYVVGARATNQYGVYGQMRAVTVNLNRRPAPAPGDFLAGRNAGPAGEVVEFEWLASVDGDIEGYRVYRVEGAARELACQTTGATQCMDTTPPSGDDLQYVVVALDRGPDDALREGPNSASRTVTISNPPPNEPSNLRGLVSGTTATLQWDAPSGSPAPAFYRIYRDGIRYQDRFGRTGSGSETTFVDSKTNGEPHSYRVTAVGSQLSESGFSNQWP